MPNVDSKTLARSIDARARALSQAARTFASVEFANLVDHRDVFRAMDMLKARLDDEWQLFVLRYEEETLRLAASPFIRPAGWGEIDMFQPPTPK